MIQNGKRNYQAPSDALASWLTGTNAWGLPRSSNVSNVRSTQPTSTQFPRFNLCKMLETQRSRLTQYYFSNQIRIWKVLGEKGWLRDKFEQKHRSKYCQELLTDLKWLVDFYNKSPYIEWSFGEMKSQYTTKRYFHFAPSSNEFAPWSPNMPSSGKES